MAEQWNANVNNNNNSKSDTHELKQVTSDVTAKQSAGRSASSGRVAQVPEAGFIERRRAQFEQNRKVFQGDSEADAHQRTSHRSQVALLVTSFENVIRATSQPSVAQHQSTHDVTNQSATSVEGSGNENATHFVGDVTRGDVKQCEQDVTSVTRAGDDECSCFSQLFDTSLTTSFVSFQI